MTHLEAQIDGKDMQEPDTGRPSNILSLEALQQQLAVIRIDETNLLASVADPEQLKKLEAALADPSY